MSIFGSSKKRISKNEWDEIQNRLYSRGFSKRERDEAEKIFHGSLDESQETERGIDAEELVKALEYMRKNKSAHGLSDEKINILEEELKNKL